MDKCKEIWLVDMSLTHFIDGALLKLNETWAVQVSLHVGYNCHGKPLKQANIRAIIQATFKCSFFAGNRI